MNARPRVLFIDRDPPSGFMAADKELLEGLAEVERLVYPGRPSLSWAARSLAAVRRNEVVYAFFASEHSLLPALAARLLRRRFVLVPAGYDYAHVPEHRYGLRARGLGWLPWLLGRWCDVALPISDQTLWEFLDSVPSAAPHTARSYLAVNADRWRDPGATRDVNQVVTLAYVDEEAWSRKGIDRFVAAAAADPGRSYVLAGRLVPSVAARVAALALPNLHCPGRLDHDEIRRLFWSSGTYAQLSWHETFGVAMAEAMLCGCVPVIRQSPTLAEVAGPWAVKVGDRHPDETDPEAIDRAANGVTPATRSAMGADVARRFAPSRRQAMLAAAVSGRVPVDPGPEPA